MAGKRRKSTNYVNNAKLLEEIAASKARWEKEKKGIKDPDDMPSAAECMTPELVKMLVMLVDRYSQKSNWRNYCVDEATECLTKRGWLDIDHLTISDEILSYSRGKLVWSKIESIFSSPFKGDMFNLTAQGIDALVTPEHKFMTDNGLKKVELLREKDKIILMGDAVESPHARFFSDTFVELVGWSIGGDTTPLEEIHLKSVAPDKVLSMNFILKLTPSQREILIDTMVDGDGWRDNGINYTRASKEQIDSFVALCTISGYQTSVRVRESVGFDRKPIYTVQVSSPSRRSSLVKNVNFHGGKNKDRVIGQPKETYPNFPTKYYQGRVWCPKTE